MGGSGGGGGFVMGRPVHPDVGNFALQMEEGTAVPVPPPGYAVHAVSASSQGGAPPPPINPKFVRPMPNVGGMSASAIQQGIPMAMHANPNPNMVGATSGGPIITSQGSLPQQQQQGFNAFQGEGRKLGGGN